MADEHQSANTSQEPLMRRFLPIQNKAVIPSTAFRPTAEDVTGISVSFQSYPTPIHRILTDTRKPPECYSVCEFDLDQMNGLSVFPSATNADPGYATIPEIAPPYDELKNSDERKIQLRAWQAELVRRASIIHNAGDSLIDPFDIEQSYASRPMVGRSDNVRPTVGRVAQRHTTTSN